MNRLPLLLLVSIGTLLAACSQNEPLADLPSLIEIHPANGATDVPVTVQVTATFDGPLADLEALDGLTVMLGDQNVAGELSVEDDSLVFTPVDALEEGALYSVKLGSSVAALATAGLVDGGSWSFTTASAGTDDGGSGSDGSDGSGGSQDSDGDGLYDDVDPDPSNPDTDGDGLLDGDDPDPTNADADDDGVIDGEDPDLGLERVVSVSPMPQAEVGNYPVIAITFDEDLDCDTVEADALEVFTLVPGLMKRNNGADSVPVAGDLECSGATITFTPEGSLDTNNDWFWLFIQVDALDVHGDPVEVSTQWRFRTR